MNGNKLKGKIVEKQFTQEKLAEMLGISVQTLNAKLNGRKKFNLDEVVSITHILAIQDPVDIFFENDTPNMQR